MNTIMIVGRIVSDCVMCPTAPYPMAINTLASIPSSQKKETMFTPFKVFGKLASDIFCKYCKKGDTIVLSGYLTQDNFTTKEGNKATKYWINVDKIQMVGSRNQIEETPEEFYYNANAFNNVSNPPKKETPKQTPQNQSMNPFDDIDNGFVNDDDLPI